MSLLGDRLRQQAADRNAVHAGRWWTYGELIAAAEPIAHRITALGLGAGDVVALPIDRGIEAVIGLCATLVAGAIPAVLDPRVPEVAASTLARLRPALVLVAPADAQLPHAIAIELRGAHAELSASAAAAADAVRRDPGISHVIFTSGSTAETKGVVWSELRASFDWASTPPPQARRDRPTAIVASLCTGLGYHELVHSLYHGTAVALLHAPFLATLPQIRELGIDRLRLTPTHVELLLATAEVLPDVAIVSIASAAITPERMRELAARVPKARLCRAYGLTESGPASAVWSDHNPRKLHTVGRAVAYRRITVRDPDGNMLRPDTPGEVVIELPMWDACDGYLDASPELARRFRNGTLWTGDHGTVDRHGFLVLAGREAEVLKIGGRSVSAPQIEAALGGMPGVAELAVVGVPDRWLGEIPCAIYVPAAGSDPRTLADEAAARSAIAEDTPRWWLARRELPRGPTHKLRRGLLAREAARWTEAFPQVIAPTHQRYPAYDLDGGLAVVDGCPWVGDGALDPCARPITLVTRRPLGARAIAAIQAGSAARYIVGPLAAAPEVPAAELEVFAGELVRLARIAPGAAPAAICAFGDRASYAAAGLVPIPGAPGWTWQVDLALGAGAGRESGPGRSVTRGEVEDEVRAALPELARAIDVLAAWCHRA